MCLITLIASVMSGPVSLALIHIFFGEIYSATIDLSWDSIDFKKER